MFEDISVCVCVCNDIKKYKWNYMFHHINSDEVELLDLSMEDQLTKISGNILYLSLVGSDKSMHGLIIDSSYQNTKKLL